MLTYGCSQRLLFKRSLAFLSLYIGMIGIGAPTLLAQTSGALRAFDIPLISASPEHADSLVGRSADNVLTTAPDMSGQARVRTNESFHMSCNESQDAL